MGAAYRPLAFDDLNLIGRYTFQQNKAPGGQVDEAGVDREKLHVFSAEAIYDINDKWQLAEKIAYRISQETVTGFEFTRTHTWLTAHRLNYKVDKDWQVSGEYRMLTQREAKDRKQGFLMEASRKINDSTQMGLGYNFTTFNDDLTSLDYKSQGPFVRVTGTMYDRTPEEKERALIKRQEERISQWSWALVQRELNRLDSPVVEELNYMFALAQGAEDLSKLDDARAIYRDIITAGQIMFEEAAEYFRGRIVFQEKLEDMDQAASNYFKKGELQKAQKLWEKIVEDAQKAMVE